MGNYDDGIGYFRIACGCDYPNEEAMERGLKSVAWTKANTPEAHKAYLWNPPYRLEREFEGHQVVLVHASPVALNEYLFEDVADDVFRAHLAATGADVLIWRLFAFNGLLDFAAADDHFKKVSEYLLPEKEIELVS